MAEPTSISKKNKVNIKSVDQDAGFRPNMLALASGNLVAGFNANGTTYADYIDFFSGSISLFPTPKRLKKTLYFDTSSFKFKYIYVDTELQKKYFDLDYKNISNNIIDSDNESINDELNDLNFQAIKNMDYNPFVFSLNNGVEQKFDKEIFATSITGIYGGAIDSFVYIDEALQSFNVVDDIPNFEVMENGVYEIGSKIFFSNPNQHSFTIMIVKLTDLSPFHEVLYSKLIDSYDSIIDLSISTLIELRKNDKITMAISMQNSDAPLIDFNAYFYGNRIFSKKRNEVIGFLDANQVIGFLDTNEVIGYIYE